MSNARVLFSTGSLFTYDLAHVFDLAAEAGYDGIEMMCDTRYASRNPAYLGELAQRLPIIVLHTPFGGRLMGWSNTHSEITRVQRTLKLAEQLDAQTIVVHLPSKFGWASLNLGKTYIRWPWPGVSRDFKRWLDAGELITLQANTSVQIAVENMPVRNFLGFRSNAAWFNSIDEWSAFHEHLTLDTTHWATFGLSSIEAYHAAGPRVKHIHLSNYDGREHRLPHRGDVDLGAFLQAVAASGYTGTISIEVTPDALAYDNIKAVQRNLRESLEFVRTHLS